MLRRGKAGKVKSKWLGVKKWHGLTGFYDSKEAIDYMANAIGCEPYELAFDNTNWFHGRVEQDIYPQKWLIFFDNEIEMPFIGDVVFCYEDEKYVLAVKQGVEWYCFMVYKYQECDK